MVGCEVHEDAECIVCLLINITSTWCPTTLQTLQDGISCLGDFLGRDILWRYLETTPLVDVLADASSSGSVPSSPLIDPHEPLVVKDESPFSSSSFVPLDLTPQVDRQDLSYSSWHGMLWQMEDGEGLVLTYGRIQASQPEDIFLASLLSEEDVGIVVTSVLFGDDLDVMSLQRWPIIKTRLLGSLLLFDLLSRFYKFPVVDPDSNSLFGVSKAPYNFSNRRRKTSTLVTKSKRLLQQSSIRLVSSEYCCLRKCCQTFLWKKILACHTKYWALSFDERRELGWDVFKRLHAA